MVISVKLRETVAYAAARSPFYRERLEGIDAAAITCPSDLSRLPQRQPVAPADLVRPPARRYGEGGGCPWPN